MPNVIQILRSSTAGSRPAGKSPGEIYVNFADRQLGVWDAAGPSDIVAVRYFSTLAVYGVGDHVIQAGVLYFANSPTGPGAFVPASWTAVSVGGGPFLPLSAGPTQALTGELYLPAPAPSQPNVAANKAYVDAGDAILQSEIDLLASNLLFVGSINVVTNVGAYTAASGIPPGALPAAGPGNANFYVIVSVGGTAAAGNIPAGTYEVGDWLVSTGAPPWARLPIGQATVIASQVGITPPIAALGANVQTGLTWLDTFKLDLAGGTMTGPLTLAADPVAPLEPVTLQFLDDIIIDAGVYP